MSDMQTPDTDTRAVVELLRGALAASAMTQHAFAHTVGTSAPRLSTYLSGTTRPSAYFCLRAQRLARSLAAARAQGLMSAPVVAEALRAHLHMDDVEWAWRILLQGRDHLRLILNNQDEELMGAWEAVPSSTGFNRIDTLFAALTAHEFDAADRTVPTWATVSALPDPWIPAHPFLSNHRVIATTPSWLRELNIYIPERDLVTA